MIEELAMVFGSHIVAAEDVYPSSFEYRLHKIQTVDEGDEVAALIYDGEQEVQRVYGKDYHHAIARAKAWIDEQDEPVSEYDLHIAA